MRQPPPGSWAGSWAVACAVAVLQCSEGAAAVTVLQLWRRYSIGGAIAVALLQH